MSKENVEIVRRIYDAAARRNSEAVLALYDPHVVLDATRMGVAGLGTPESQHISHGHEGLRSFFREWHEAWENIAYDFDELIDAGGDRVISVVTRRGRGRASGAEVELSVALVWTIREDKVVRLVWFRTRTEALEAAGLSD